MRLLTREQFGDKLKEKYLNDSLNVLEYDGMNNATRVQCNICGFVHSFTRAQNALTRRGDFCKKHRRTAELEGVLKHFKTWIQNSNFELITDLSEITNSQQHIQTRCKFCGKIQESKRIYDYYAGKQCYCQTKSVTKPLNILLEQLQGEYELLEPYTNTDDKLLYRHKCGTEVRARTADILRGHIACPKCRVISKGQMAIKHFLELREISYFEEYRVPINGITFRYDFYLPELNIMIEYNGEQHYRPVDFFGGQPAFEQRQHYDAIKIDYCLQQDITLIVIRYDEDIQQRLSEVI